MTATVALYCPPVIVRGQQCAEAPLTAGGATEQLPGGVAVSRAGGGLTAEPSWLPSAAGAASHRNTVRRPAGRRLVMVAQMSGCRSWLGVALSASSVSVHASRCPVSARAVSARAVSARAMSARPVPNVRVSIVRGVRRRCPRSASPSASVVSARVPSWSASGSHTAEPAQAVLGQRSRRAGPGRRRGGARAADRVRSHGRPGTRRLRRIARRSGGAGRRAVHPKLWHGCAQVVRAGLAAGGRP
jgi:hypothetical protein